MPEFDENGLFVGLSKDDKATAVLEHLRVDQEVTLQGLVSATGLSVSQIHAGIRHLREAKPQCVVTIRKGPVSSYKLAENAPEVRDYALRRMKHWQTQISVMKQEMETAQALFPATFANKVSRTAGILDSLLKVFMDFGQSEMELQRERDKFEREKARIRTPRRSRAKAAS